MILKKSLINRQASRIIAKENNPKSYLQILIMAPVPIYVKGGMWTNLEDQILKAAVQKYGTHAWSKVASLLQKKNARQCQSRWDEYLNPALNFTVFSKDDDDKLMELSRKIPNQWRTIAEFMGRPAQACVDRYNALLAIDNDDLELKSSFEVGDINPNNESLPAKADNETLLDEEREMLVEARARLLNTQGKKATRKIRERMLEESKRIAFLQKRRELKQAGVDSKIKAPKKKYSSQIDYNDDVVYEQEPLPGIYDTTKEDERTAALLQKFEKSVEKKGLSEKKTGDGKRSSKRKNDQQSPLSVTGTDSVLTNEYKKPRLDLAAPASKNHGQKKPSILALFDMLPPPKNDFEIVVEDPESEIEDVSTPNEVITENTETTKPNEDDLDRTEKDPMIAYIPTCFAKSSITTPAYISNPKNEIEREFNRLVQAKTDNTAILEPASLVQYMTRIKSNALPDKTDVLYHPGVSKLLENDDEEDLQKKVIGLEHNVYELRTSVEASVQAHRHVVDRLAEEFHNTLKPNVTELEKRYYTDYQKYTHEYTSIQETKQRLLHDLQLALR